MRPLSPISFIFTARKRSLGQGNSFRSACQEFCPQWGGSHGTPWQGGPSGKETPLARRPPWQGDPPSRPTPRGEIGGIRSRPTPKGEIDGEQIQAHTQGGNWGGSGPDPPKQLLLRVVHILLEYILVHAIFGKNLAKQECIPVGCILPTCCPYLPACTAPGRYLPLVWGVSAPRGCTCLWSGGGGCIPACNGADPPCEQNDRQVQNITLPQTSFAVGNNRFLPKTERLAPPSGHSWIHHCETDGKFSEILWSEQTDLIDLDLSRLDSISTLKVYLSNVAFPSTPPAGQLRTNLRRLVPQITFLQLT